MEAKSRSRERPVTRGISSGNTAGARRDATPPMANQQNISTSGKIGGPLVAAASGRRITATSCCGDGGIAASRVVNRRAR